MDASQSVERPEHHHNARSSLRSKPLWKRMLDPDDRENLVQLLQLSLEGGSTTELFVKDVGLLSHARNGGMERLRKTTSHEHYLRGCVKLMRRTREAIVRSGCVATTTELDGVNGVDDLIKIDFEQLLDAVRSGSAQKAVLRSESDRPSPQLLEELRGVLDGWWLLVTAETGAGRLMTIGKEQYIKTFSRLSDALCLLQGMLPFDDIARMDWAQDSRGRLTMTQRVFFKCLFTISACWMPFRNGSWLHKEAIAHHISFLRGTYDHCVESMAASGALGHVSIRPFIGRPEEQEATQRRESRMEGRSNSPAEMETSSPPLVAQEAGSALTFLPASPYVVFGQTKTPQFIEQLKDSASATAGPKVSNGTVIGNKTLRVRPFSGLKFQQHPSNSSPPRQQSGAHGPQKYYWGWSNGPSKGQRSKTEALRNVALSPVTQSAVSPNAAPTGRSPSPIRKSPSPNTYMSIVPETNNVRAGAIQSFLDTIGPLQESGTFAIMLNIFSTKGSASEVFGSHTSLEDLLRTVGCGTERETTVTLRKGSATIRNVGTTAELLDAVYELSVGDLRSHQASTPNGPPAGIDGFTIARRCQWVQLRAVVDGK